MSTRSAGIDILRVVGIAAVVVGHVWSDSVTRAAVYTWHVPLFFLLTGYFWTPGRPLGGELRKRWRSLGLPYVTWFVLLFATLAAAEAATGQVADGAFRDALYGGSAAVRPFSAFWFVSVLFLIAVAYRGLERFPAVVTWAVALVGLVVAYLAPGFVTAAPLGLFLVPACLVFVLSGRLLRQLRPQLPTAAAAAMLAVGVLLVVTGLSTPLDVKAGDFGVPGLGVLTAVLISGGLVCLAEELDSRVGPGSARTIGRLSACGIAVVLSHAGVLWVLHTPPDGGFLDLAAALVLPWAFALVALRTAASPYLLGTAAARP
ncbi:acyltransferase family protein [Micromonospora purpureochromogenes]|uniref:acyltransferase family protein n=1 Tax=Micromonospora purpureochromogenes TaxID=47872 RepID=UPI00155F5AA1|nr:acyltransferase family protein [Micromonospora purpureochromogenes]